MVIDLHGLKTNEAIPYILNSIFSFLQDEWENKLTIITGKGMGILFEETLSILDEQDEIYYNILDNTCIEVKKISSHNF